jgi:hypothetical protein
MTAMESAFWAWVDRRLSEPDTAGMSEQAFLDGIKTPGWTGMKARTKPAPMPAIRDRKMAAAGDI